VKLRIKKFGQDYYSNDVGIITNRPNCDVKLKRGLKRLLRKSRRQEGKQEIRNTD